MRVLLDEHLDHRLRPLFDPVHDVRTVREQGWCGTKNGALLQAAQAEFDVLVTMDRGIPHQQDVSGLPLSVVLLRAVSNRRADTAPLMPRVNEALSVIKPGQILEVES